MNQPEKSHGLASVMVLVKAGTKTYYHWRENKLQTLPPNKCHHPSVRRAHGMRHISLVNVPQDASPLKYMAYAESLVLAVSYWIPNLSAPKRGCLGKVLAHFFPSNCAITYLYLRLCAGEPLSLRKECSHAGECIWAICSFDFSLALLSHKPA